jgi:hypothetical protein
MHQTLSHRPEVLLVLVHGTWARGIWKSKRTDPRRPRWFEPGSTFCSDLARRLESNCVQAKFESIDWSGSNSFNEREKAAQQLAELLRRRHRSDLNTPIVVVGHSHGGNVAIRALDILTEGIGETYIATLATPFVEVTRTPLADNARSSLRILLLFQLICAAVLVYLPFNYLGLSYTFNETGPPTDRGLVLKALSATCFIVTLASFGVLSRSLVAFSRRTSGAIELMSSQSDQSLRSARLLALRAIDDEAAFAIAAGAIAARLSTLTLRVLGALRPLRLALGALAVAMVLLAYSQVLFGGLNVHLETAARWFLAWFFWLPTIIFFVVTTALVLRSVHGWDLSFAGLDYEVNVQSVPDGDNFSVLTLRGDTPVWRLRHGIYDHPQCSAALADWIAGQMDKKGV